MGTSHRFYAAQIVVAVMSVVLLVFAATRAASHDAMPDRASATVRVVVQQGDTLWSIAKRLDVPGSSLPLKVSAIRAVNDLRTSQLRPGQILVVPVESRHGAVAQRLEDPLLQRQ